MFLSIPDASSNLVLWPNGPVASSVARGGRGRLSDGTGLLEFILQPAIAFEGGMHFIKQAQLSGSPQRLLGRLLLQYQFQLVAYPVAGYGVQHG